MRVLTIQEDKGEYIHIPGVPCTTYETLCGFCDTPVILKRFDGKPTCPSCLEILRYCKKLKN